MEIKEELEDNHPISKKRIAHTRKTPSVVAKATEMKEQDEDAELWRRLDELEHQEEEKSQHDNYQQKDEKATAAITEDHKRVATNVINISHTSLLMPNISSDKTHTAPGAINSPADICVKKAPVDSAVHADEPVVKSKSVHWSSDVTSPPKPSPESVTTTKPFTGSVVEKSTPATVPTVSYYYIPLNLIISTFRTQDARCPGLKHLGKLESQVAAKIN